MKKKYLYIACVILLTSCNSLSDDFFEFVFNSKGINIERVCSDNPSFLSEGRSFEIYSMSKIDSDLVILNIFNTSKFINSRKYSRYEIPKWKKTPINDREDTVYSFIRTEMNDKENTCFSKNKLIEILQQERNYYTFLYDDLGRAKLFIWDTKEKILFLLTSYEL